MYNGLSTDCGYSLDKQSSVVLKNCNVPSLQISAAPDTENIAALM